MNEDQLVQDEQQFADAFAEFAGSNQPAEPADPAPEPVEPTEPTAPEEPVEPAEKPAQEAAPPAEPAEAPKPEEGGDKKPEQPKTIEQLQSELDELRHRERSASGRIGAFQKRVNELEQKIKSSQEEFLNKIKSGDFEKVRQDFPELARYIDGQIAAVTEHLQKQTVARLEPLQAEVYDQIKYEQEAAVEAAHPGWKSLIVSQEFGQWLSNQPKQVQSLADSDSAADAAALLNIYKAMAQPAPPQRDVQAPVDQAQAARRAQLQNAVGIQSRSQAQRTQSGVPNEFDAAFNHFVESDPRFKN